MPAPSNVGSILQLPPYKGRLTDWDNCASVRTLPKRHYDNAPGTLPFSPELVPLLAHPLVAARGPQAQHAVLAQKLHSYVGFTEHLELRAVIPSCVNLRFGNVPFHVPHELRRDAVKIATDEAHHADCAGDLADQIVRATGVVPYSQHEPGFFEILRKCSDLLSSRMKLLAETAFSCVSETLITGTLMQVPKDNRVTPAIREVIFDHARDEARHHAVFSDVMRIMWEQLSTEEKDVVGPLFATFIQAFLAPDHRAELGWLEAAGFEDQEAAKIINETYECFDQRQACRDASRATVSLMRRFGMLDHTATHEALQAAGLINRRNHLAIGSERHDP